MPKQSAAIVVIAAFSCGAMESSRYIISDVSRNQSSLPSRRVPDSTRTAGESGRSARAPDAPIQSTSRNIRNRNASMHRATRALLRSLDIRHFFVVGRARLPLSLRTTTIIACCESLVATHKKSSRLASFRHRGGGGRDRAGGMRGGERVVLPRYVPALARAGRGGAGEPRGARRAELAAKCRGCAESSHRACGRGAVGPHAPPHRVHARTRRRDAAAAGRRACIRAVRAVCTIRAIRTIRAKRASHSMLHLTYGSASRGQHAMRCRPACARRARLHGRRRGWRPEPRERDPSIRVRAARRFVPARSARRRRYRMFSDLQGGTIV